MRIAIQSYGGIRCCNHHNHLSNFINQFPEIFNETNEIDFFILTTNENQSGVNENIQQIKEVLKEKMKKIDIFEEYSNEIKEKENDLYNHFLNFSENTKKLTDDEIVDYKNSLKEGIELRNKHNLYVGSLIANNNYISNLNDNTINMIKDKFVSRLYYRRALTNNMRREYEKEKKITYDWVIMCRFFDVDYIKLKPCEFLYKLPEKGIVYSCVDIFSAGCSETIEDIYDRLGYSYPVIDYEQWKDKDFLEHYHSFDIGIYYLRNDTTYCSENQLCWQSLKSSKKCINIRGNEHEISPDAYIKFIACPYRTHS